MNLNWIMCEKQYLFFSNTWTSFKFIILYFLIGVLGCVSKLILCNQSDIWEPMSRSFSGQRFQVFWNQPTHVCVNSTSGLIKPQQYGIETNDKEIFYGSKIVTFFEDKLGIYPKCLYEKQKDGTYRITKQINGGLPINQNLSLHLAKAKQDIIYAIPNPNFDGLAVIDYEHWRPVFLQNWGARIVYQEETIRRVQKYNPALPYEHIVQMSEQIFNKEAKHFMLETLRLGKSLRPNGQWGFYDYPLCEYKTSRYQNGSFSSKCSPAFRNYNDEMMWMYNESTALYPPIYFYLKPEDDVDFQIERNYVYAKLAETQRVLSILNRYIPVYMYSKNEYNEYAEAIKFYTKTSRCISIGIPAYYGITLGENKYSFKQNFSVRGVVVWSTSKNMLNRCDSINLSMERGLGKFLLKYFYRSNKCNIKNCNNHGRCIASKPMISDDELIDPFLCQHDKFRYDEFKCLCDFGFTGPNCQNLTQFENTNQQFDNTISQPNVKFFDNFNLHEIRVRRRRQYRIYGHKSTLNNIKLIKM